jgi:outer membrane protein OmpA-like peptidoglycan-associated protein
MNNQNQGFRGRFLSPGTLILGGAAILLLPLLLTACSRGAATKPSAQVASAGSMPQNSRNRAADKILLNGLQFNPDGSEIRPTSDPILDSAADILKRQPHTIVYVDSYCDPTGGRQLNRELSGDRAIAVATYLERKGIASDRLIARGFGATDFVASNATADGREQNRRVELKLVPISREASASNAIDSLSHRVFSRLFGSSSQGS